MGDVQIVGDEVSKPVASEICAVWLGSGDGYIGAAEILSIPTSSQVVDEFTLRNIVLEIS
jgi:hypothetical protein